MLIDKIQYKDFIQQLTNKFDSFCSRAPIYISYTISPTEIILKKFKGSSDTEFDLKSFPLDYCKTPEDQIAEVYYWMIDNWYPVLKQVTKVDEHYPSYKKVIEEMESGVAVEQALLKKEVVQEVTEWVLDKAYPKNSTVVLRKRPEMESYVFLLKCPTIVLLRKLRKNDFKTEFESWEFFEKNSKLLFKVEPKPNANRRTNLEQRGKTATTAEGVSGDGGPNLS